MQKYATPKLQASIVAAAFPTFGLKWNNFFIDLFLTSRLNVSLQAHEDDFRN
ncbi:hypothetical protein NC99_41040 [Sunxiuqinia dokdonensis]|uniref:Uncharacterized protein n=1 Tax=Sunxiuqinia dokdonensis TaxID=1409788 RepID=A0A0L8V3J8_9BACT|nr:hypothetical protein NC99_41040 [Sunxiuqinia dokdonensis]